MKLSSFTGLRIRRASESDATAAAALKSLVLAETPFLLETASESKFDRETLKQQIQRLSVKGCFLVAEVGAELVGMLTFGRSEFQKIQHRGGILILVRQDFCGKGMGRALLEAFLQIARMDPTLERIDISVMSGNLRAVRLYEKAGFRREGRRPRAYKLADGSYQDEIFMGLQI